MFNSSYSFTSDTALATSQCVRKNDLYSSQKGYGFVIEKNRREQEHLQIPELNSGFDPWYWLINDDLSYLCETPSGITLTAAKNDLNDWLCPLHFKADVPHDGNYKVTLTLKTLTCPDPDITIFSGRRRLMAHLYQASANTTYHYTFNVNICSIIPRGKTVPYEDLCLDLCILGNDAAIYSLAIEEASDTPTLYVAGDSTLTDQNTSYPYHPGCSYCGWAQMISFFLSPTVSVSNHAHSGLTSETFKSEGHYDIIKKHINPGDFFMFQFGHNDQKLPHMEAFGGYKRQLRTYIEEMKALGVLPILVTPLSRNTWDANGNYNDLLKDYANACIELAKKTHIPLIDLHQYSLDFITAHGVDGSKPYFYPKDYTHTNDYGALHMAAYIAHAIKSLNIQILSDAANDLLDHLTTYWFPIKSMQVPMPPTDFIETADVTNTAHFKDMDKCQHPEIITKLAQKGIITNREDCFNPTTPITRVEALEWVVKAICFVPMNVYNDYYTDVIGHEWYAGVVEVAHQNHIVDSSLTQDHLFHPLAPVTAEEMISFLIRSYCCRVKLTLTNTDFTVAGSSSFVANDLKFANQLGLLSDPFNPRIKLTREETAIYVSKLIALI